MAMIDWSKPVRFIARKELVTVVSTTVPGPFPVVSYDSDGSYYRCNLEGRFRPNSVVHFENMPEKTTRYLNLFENSWRSYRTLEQAQAGGCEGTKRPYATIRVEWSVEGLSMEVVEVYKHPLDWSLPVVGAKYGTPFTVLCTDKPGTWPVLLHDSKGNIYNTAKDGSCTVPRHSPIAGGVKNKTNLWNCYITILDSTTALIMYNDRIFNSCVVDEMGLERARTHTLFKVGLTWNSDGAFEYKIVYARCGAGVPEDVS